MPNYVYNGMTVEGTKDALDAFKAKALNVTGIREDQEQPRSFSYWNFVTPPQEAIESGEYWGAVGFSELNSHQNNSYEFNNREWGTKWDAFEVDIHENEDTTLNITWTSAWGQPEPVFRAMVNQHPNLEFQFDWEEEQGWGGEAVGTHGVFVTTKEWDIPNSHAEYVALDKEGSCNCAHEDDPKYWYNDCPNRAERIIQLAKEHNCTCSNCKVLANV